MQLACLIAISYNLLCLNPFKLTIDLLLPQTALDSFSLCKDPITSLAVFVEGDKVKVQDATGLADVVEADVEICEGVAHYVNKILNPCTGKRSCQSPSVMLGLEVYCWKCIAASWLGWLLFGVNGEVLQPAQLAYLHLVLLARCSYILELVVLYLC